MKTEITDPGRFRKLTKDALPIYRSLRENRILFYAPGIVCVLSKNQYSDVKRHIMYLLAGPHPEINLATAHRTAAWQAAIYIVLAARKAAQAAIESMRQDFTPECLTLYVNNQCNLRCRYCFSQPDDSMHETVSEPGVRAAARVVGAMCAMRNRPFSLTFHGGGEPALKPKQVERLLNTVRKEALLFGLQLRTYIATNGAVSEQTARWIADRFDLVGISCDGPPEIQNRQRPGRFEKPQSEYVENTMAILTQHGRPFHVRVTITCETINRQEEIVSYIAGRYNPAEIRIEPVYKNPSGEPLIKISHTDAFVSGFFAAQNAGAKLGVPVTTSITRPAEIYGPYCNILRRVLNLIPSDKASGCFLYSRPEQIEKNGLEIGAFNLKSRTFRLDEAKIRTLIKNSAKRPDDCDECLCSSQCTYGCPDRCVLEPPDSPPFREGNPGEFRCKVNRMLMASTVCKAADEAWDHTLPGNFQEYMDKHRMLNVLVYKDEKVDEVIF